MNKRRMISAAAVMAVAGLLAANSLMKTGEANAGKAKEPPAELKIAASRIVSVTVYQNNALVTREVDVPEGAGSMELVVSPLPSQAVNTSLYSEGSEGLRVLTTRFRLRPVKEDTREEVRKAEAQLKQLQEAAQKLQSEIKTAEENLKMVGKLEGFTAANTVSATEKGKLDGDQIITLSDYVMKQRTDRAKELVALQQQMTDNKEQSDFVGRQLRNLASGTSKVERDAIIVVDKSKAGAGKVRLNYLVGSVGWRPQYRFRSAKGDAEKVLIEYMAGVTQQTGEDWGNVKLTLSTAQPMLNAAPPDLRTLSVALVPKGAGQNPGVAFNQLGQLGGAPGQGGNPMSQKDIQQEVKRATAELRKQSVQNYNQKNATEGSRLINDAAAVEQSNEFLWAERDDLLRRKARGGAREGQSVTYALPTKLSVPSRNEEQVIEVTRIEMKPEMCYKAVPVLTPHVYRLANLTNTSEYVLLPGEATMYMGEEFVGRMDLPLVAIGEPFTAGFGVDPQLQVRREMLDKTRTQQGGNQVLKYEYRILVSSFKSKPVKVQLWERLPRSDTETVNVTVLKSEPELCKEALYEREKKPHNLLRWDLDVKAGMNGEKAVAVNYQFKVELDKQMTIGGFLSK
jgi:hypothetical protein